MKVRTEPVDKKLDIQYLVAVPMQMVLHISRRNRTLVGRYLVELLTKKFREGKGIPFTIMNPLVNVPL